MKLSDKNKNHCAYCAENYGLVVSNNSYKCVLNELENCKESNRKVPAKKIFCVICNENFYLDKTTGTCESGNISNCKTFKEDDPSTCLECITGFALISKDLSSNKNYSEAE